MVNTLQSGYNLFITLTTVLYRDFGSEKSRNNTHEKSVDTANELLTRHSPLAPLGQVDEWRQNFHNFQYKLFVGAFSNYGGLNT